VLAARVLYLVRYGWDLGWGNVGYLNHARLIALGNRGAVEEQPLAFFALVAARKAGLTAVGANEAVYLVAHFLLALGALGIARFVWPSATRRRRVILVATLALLPLLGSQSGRNNLGVTLAAGLTASALALAAAATTGSRRTRDAGSRATASASATTVLVAMPLAAALASAARYEGLVTCVGAALVLGILGRRMAGLTAQRRTAVLLAAGALGGLVAVMVIRRALAGGVVSGSSAAPGDDTYAFYTFYDGLPIAMFPHLPSTEYARYGASARFFGGFQENHGSLVRALLHHPGYALLRFVTKPLDLLVVLLWVYALTPVGAFLAVLGLGGIGRLPRDVWARRWLLAAYLFPLAMLFIPQQNPAYYLSIAVPLALAVARGADRLAARVEPRTARWLGAATVGSALVLIGAAGKLSVTNSRVLNEGAAYLEDRCRRGCLTNVLPQSLRDQSWVVTDAGAPLPAREHRNEQVIRGALPPLRIAQYDYCGRVRRARASGFTGSILYVDTRVESFRAFDADFDPEIRYEGTVDRSNLIEERRFSSGPDEVIFYRLPDDRPCVHAPGSPPRP
jgi:4-amino-4-deoxy-L-arabinose transferase-like glycosyltransferase